KQETNVLRAAAGGDGRGTRVSTPRAGVENLPFVEATVSADLDEAGADATERGAGTHRHRGRNGDRHRRRGGVAAGDGGGGGGGGAALGAGCGGGSAFRRVALDRDVVRRRTGTRGSQHRTRGRGGAAEKLAAGFGHRFSGGYEGVSGFLLI